MDLHSGDGELPVAQPHDLALGRARVDDEAGRHGVGPDDERVVARRLERARQPREDPVVVVQDRRGLAVHQPPGAHDLAAEHLADGLVPEADAEHGYARAEFADDGLADAGVARFARPRGDAHACGIQRGEFVHGDLVVATHDGLRAEFAEVLDEVVRERVVVIEDEEHGWE